MINGCVVSRGDYKYKETQCNFFKNSSYYLERSDISKLSQTDRIIEDCFKKFG